MRVYPGDFQPSSVLHGRQLSGSAWAGGILASLGAHAGIVAVIVGASMVELPGSKPQSYIEERVVEARFVQLGKKPDPKRLPKRKVPRKTTAPEDSVAVSKDMDPPKPKKKKEERPQDATEDLLTRLGDRAQAFAEIAEEKEREGDPEGLVDGTETESREGDIYLGKLVSFFKRGWTIPSTLGDTKHLVTVTTVEITPDLRIGAYEVVESSGEPMFDQSVEDRYNQLRELGTTLPEPPPEVANQFLGQTIKIRFRGQAAQ